MCELLVSIFDRLFISSVIVHDDDPNCTHTSICVPGSSFSYFAFCKDFGPLNLVCIHRFCTQLKHILHQSPTKKVVICGENDKSFTNAAFLIGSYLVIAVGLAPEEVDARFNVVAHKLLCYRDVSPGHSRFKLRLRDCWEALAKAKEIGWVNFGSSSATFDPEEYEHYANPLNADLHVVVPNKLVAMAGPVSFPGGDSWQDSAGVRRFAPHYTLQTLEEFDVQAVVRLNKPEYNAEAFTAAGIAIADLPFEDCTTPPPDVVLKFMTIVERVDGPIAVHCRAGLGRTGTLIGLYLMKHFEFTARQAIAWLRIVRPGSVIGIQQEFLCEQERHMPIARKTFSRTFKTQCLQKDVSRASVEVDGERSAFIRTGPNFVAISSMIAEIVVAVDKLSLIRRLHTSTFSKHQVLRSASVGLRFDAPLEISTPVYLPAIGEESILKTHQASTSKGSCGSGRSIRRGESNCCIASSRMQLLRRNGLQLPRKSVSFFWPSEDDHDTEAAALADMSQCGGKHCI